MNDILTHEMAKEYADIYHRDLEDERPRARDRLDCGELFTTTSGLLLPTGREPFRRHQQCVHVSYGALPPHPEGNREMKLTLLRVVRTDSCVRSFKDRRVLVNRTLAEYKGDDGEIYRKSFEVKACNPVVPQEGTHETLNAMQYQWQ